MTRTSASRFKTTAPKSLVLRSEEEGQILWLDRPFSDQGLDRKRGEVFTCEKNHKTLKLDGGSMIVFLQDSGMFEIPGMRLKVRARKGSALVWDPIKVQTPLVVFCEPQKPAYSFAVIKAPAL